MRAALLLLLAMLSWGSWRLGDVAAGNATSSCGNCQGNNGKGGGNGGGDDPGAPGKALTATVTNVTPIAPGHGGTVTVRVTNPNNQPVVVTRVAGTVNSVTTGSRPGLPSCDKVWFTLGEFSGTRPIAKLASDTVSMPVSLRDTTFNQDNCKHVAYSFSFTVHGRQS